MARNSGLRPETAAIFDRLDALGLKQRDLAAALTLEENKVSKVRSGERQFKAPEMMRALEWLSEREGVALSVNAVPVGFSSDPAKPMPRDLPIYGTALGGEVTIDGCAVEQTELNSDNRIFPLAKLPIIA